LAAILTHLAPPNGRATGYAATDRCQVGRPLWTRFTIAFQSFGSATGEAASHEQSAFAARERGSTSAIFGPVTRFARKGLRSTLTENGEKVLVALDGESLEAALQTCPLPPFNAGDTGGHDW